MRHHYIDPAYPDYLGGKLFDTDDPRLNRDDYLRPFRSMKDRLEAQGMRVETADGLFQNGLDTVGEYHSFGMLGNLERVAALPNVRMHAFVTFEPPVVAPRLYEALPELTRHFEQVYVHNTHGDGYSLNGIDVSRLRKLWWPQQYEDVLEPHWMNKDRKRKAAVINNNKKPRLEEEELYSVRIEAVAELADLNAVDLFGGGWDRWLMREGRFKWALWHPAFRHRKTLRRVWKGTVPSKYDVLAQYDFCLCLENMRMDGYMTEKLFDCLYTGTVPIYLGPRDVAEMVPPEVFIDASAFGSWTEAWKHARSLTDEEMQAYRAAGRDFLCGEASRPFKDSLVNILS